MQTCPFDLTQNLNESEKKSEKTGKKSESFYQNSTFYRVITTNFKAKKSEF